MYVPNPDFDYPIQLHVFEGELSINLQVPLSSQLSHNGPYSLSIDEVDGEWRIWFLENLQNRLHLCVKWSVELPYDSNYFEESVSFFARQGVVRTARQVDHRFALEASVLTPGFVIKEAVGTFIVRLARVISSPSLLDQFSDARHQDIIPLVRLRVNGQSYDIDNSQSFIRSATSMSWPPEQINSNELERLIVAPEAKYHYLGILADRGATRLDIYSATVALGTELETAAYTLLGPRIAYAEGKDEKPNFTIDKYLGEHPDKESRTKTYPVSINGGTSFAEVDPECYIRCAELWGARNELVHEGQTAIRCFDTQKGCVRKENLRPLTWGDVTLFRRSVRTAIQWMENTEE